MGQTMIEYSLFNKPLSQDADVPREDAWNYQYPFHTFPLGTTIHQANLLYDAYVASAKKRPRLVGTARTPSTVKLRARRVAFTDYQDVPSSGTAATITNLSKGSTTSAKILSNA